MTMDFVSGLPRTQRNHDAIWVIVDRLTKSAHFLAIGMDYSLECLDELYINEIVRLHGILVSIVSDRDPRVGPVAYKLALPPELDKIHNVFHVSMLRRYRSDPPYVLPVESIEVNPDLTYNEEPTLVQAREIKQLRNKRSL
ncbi:hypothetical protein MTR67_039484 [Solanum verrucosum]|uniref:Tf2-1-like SH3-like domain-containing protein n=1 Tax=Solanum verrucosum TaxID=315347 RepID=A0AAF0ZR81_SOLVR|nr:hypothetical protein MTR67_039484 [Solanum verrucosum]